MTTSAGSMRTFLRAARTRPFQWGIFDCCLFAADWVLACTGRDPAAPWRGSYCDETGARALIDAAGGLPALFAAGLRGLDGPELAVIDAGQGEAGAIPAGRMFAVLTPRGVGSVRDDCCRVVWRG